MKTKLFTPQNNIKNTISQKAILMAISMCISFSSGAGWFGYDNHEECMDEEMGEMMSREVNPFPQGNAYRAALLLCKKYPTKEELRLKSMSLSELHSEKERLLKRQEECQKIGTKCLISEKTRYDFFGPKIDAEIERR